MKSFPIHTAIFVDVFNLIQHLRIAFQQEEQDHVKVAQQIEEFNWTMAKLKILFESSLDGQSTLLTHSKQPLGKIDAQNDITKNMFRYQLKK